MNINIKHIKKAKCMKSENAKSQECKCLYEGKIARFSIAYAVYLFAGFLKKDSIHHRMNSSKSLVIIIIIIWRCSHNS